MPVSDDEPRSVIELALQGLQEERTSCVRRLQAVLDSKGAETEIEGYMRLIDNINAALIRLAGARVLA